MENATENQKSQFISLAALGFNPQLFDKERFQDFLKDPKRWLAFAEFISAYKLSSLDDFVIRRESIPESHHEYLDRRLFEGAIEKPASIDFVELADFVWMHSNQTSSFGDIQPTGEDILRALVKSYGVGGKDTCAVARNDLIHGHYGYAELKHLEDSWSSLPCAFRAWSSNRQLYGWRDVAWQYKGGAPSLYLVIPYLGTVNPKDTSPRVSWALVRNGRWMSRMPALRGKYVEKWS